MVDRRSRIKLSAGQISWREAGDARLPTVIFLHGSWHDSTQWHEAIEISSKKFHCLAIDLLGYGNSTAIETSTSIEMQVDCLHEFLTALNLRPVYLLGHSLGAWIALAYTLKYPDLVRGAIAISPEGFSLANWQQYSILTKFLLARPWLFKLWLNGLKALTSVIDGASPLAKSQAYWSFFNKFPTTRKLLFERSNRVIRRELVAERIALFKPPLLIIQSDADDRAVIEQSQACSQAFDRAEFKLIKEADFAPQVLTIQITREIEGFIDRIQAQIDREKVELW